MKNITDKKATPWNRHFPQQSNDIQSFKKFRTVTESKCPSVTIKVRPNVAAYVLLVTHESQVLFAVRRLVFLRFLTVFLSPSKQTTTTSPI